MSSITDNHPNYSRSNLTTNNIQGTVERGNNKNYKTIENISNSFNNNDPLSVLYHKQNNFFIMLKKK